MADRSTAIKELSKLLADTNLEDPDDIVVTHVKHKNDKKKGMIAIVHQNHVTEENFEEYYNNLTTQLLQGVPEKDHLLYRLQAFEQYQELRGTDAPILTEVGEYHWARVVIKHDYDPVKRVGTIIIEAIRIEKGNPNKLSSVRLRYKFTYRSDKAANTELKCVNISEDGTPWHDDIEQSDERSAADVSCETGIFGRIAGHMSQVLNYFEPNDPEDPTNAPEPAQCKTVSFMIGPQQAVLEAYRAAGELLSKTHGDEQSSLTQNNAARNLYSSQKLQCFFVTITTLFTILGMVQQFWPPAKKDTSA
eukprot:GEMP01074263.1.p1 GENE.GEMP01074263.1~~GEMP01074263.1.p1  ORF type:complete len:305 (+),score=31.47 GEMP01074263.1:31-945(+)